MRSTSAMGPPSKTEIFNRKGSHAGRGFHYQDAVGVWLAVSAWRQVLGYGEIVPEGRDDFELRGGGLAFVQAKSRRDGLGPFSAAATIGFVEALWARHEAAAVKPDQLVLILERGVAGWASGTGELLGRGLTLDDIAGTALLGHPGRATLLAKTRLLVLDAPMEASVKRLAAGLACPPLTAEIYYGELLRRIGRLSDENGEAKGDFAGLALSDTVQALEELRAHVALDDTPQALALGLCETIDFVTPFDDPMFYLGVDVRPGHLAAGLVAERPAPRQRVLEALETRFAALVVGPSGAGKSALMWEAARASRHAVRWFKVARLRVEDVAAVARLARAMRASREAPIGLVFDDVGRGLSEGWDAMLRQARGGDIILLGSIREEDAFLLQARASAAEIRELGDEELAERLWRGLREGQQTDWAGWREPWSQSQGLLLEYAHLLTRGERMARLLGEQVDRRLAERRFEELDILAIVAVAGAAGVGVEAEGLPAVLGQHPGAVALALSRLVDEHLVRRDAKGRLEGLHPLRSEALSRLIHAKPPLALTTSLVRAITLMSSADLERFIGRVLVAHPDTSGVVVEAVTARLAQTRDPEVLAAGLHGLGEAHIMRTVRRWLPELGRLEVPPTQATTAALFGLANNADDMPDIEALRPVLAAARLLKKATEDDPRAALLASLPDEIVTVTVARAAPADLVRILGGLIDGPAAGAVLGAVGKARPDFDRLDLVTVVKVLETAHLLDPSIPKTWVAAFGQVALLARLHREAPWSTAISLKSENGAQIVAGDILYLDAAAQPDVHAEVVRLCEMMIALAPGAERADARALAADGTLAGLTDLPLATKTILRENLPPGVLPEWNRRWAAVIASEVAMASQSAYLARAREIMTDLVPTLEKTFDDYLRGQVRDPDLRKLEAILVELRQLTPPRTTADGGAATYVTALQGVLFDATLELLRRFNTAWENAAAFLQWSKALPDRLPAARGEPWALVGGEPADLFDRLTFLIDTVRLVAGEAGARGGDPGIIWRKTIKAARKGNALRVIGLEIRARIERRLNAIAEAVERAAPGAQAHVRLDLEQPSVWPPCQVLVVLPVRSVADWHGAWLGIWDDVRGVAPNGAEVLLTPSVDGVVVSDLTMQGLDAPLPGFDAANVWLVAEGYDLLDAERARAWGKVLNGLTVGDGMRRLGYGVEGRPSVEIDALAASVVAVEAGLAELELLLATSAPDVWAAIGAFVAEVQGGGVALAADVAGLQKGVGSDVVGDLTVLNTALLTWDLRARL